MVLIVRQESYCKHKCESDSFVITIFRRATGSRKKTADVEIISGEIEREREKSK